MPDTIPPPPKIPSDRPTEVDEPLDSLADLEREVAKAKPFEKLKKWGAILGTITGIFSALGGVWKAIDSIDNLHDTILANKEAVARISQENLRAHRQMRDDVNQILEAVRQARAQDQEVITNLRIAIATLQAAQGVREGRTVYNPSTIPGVSPRDPLAGLSLAEAPPEAPRNSRARREMADRAEEDAQRALERAEEADMREDPLDNLIRREF